MEVKILSFNCQGICSIEKRLDVFNYLKAKNCDIYCLQDVHSTQQTEKFIQTQWGNNNCLFSSGTSNKRGVAILFNKSIDFVIHNQCSDPEGNYIIIDITVDNHRFTLINLYGPNIDSPIFFDNIMSKAQLLNSNNPFILCGDFNVVQDYNLDNYNYKKQNNKKAHDKILEIKQDLNLIDPFRENNPLSRRYSWRKHSKPLQMSRLDYFLLSESLHSSVNKCLIEPSYRSDHSMVILKMSFTNFIPGRPLWKHNNSLLTDIEYLNTINSKIHEIKCQYALPIYNFENISLVPDNQLQFTIDDQLFLEVLLMEIRGKSISYSCYKKKKNDQLEKDLISQIDKIENNVTNENIDYIENLKINLQNIRKHKMQGHMIRSRAQIIENDEKPTKYFCNLETYKAVNKIIPKLVKQDGIITDQHDILNEAKDFYHNLYSSKDKNLTDINLEKEFNDYDIPKLSSDESNSIEGLISYEEASLCLKTMANNKSPGTSGFNADFFKVFWKYLGHFIVRSINFGFNKGELSVTQKEGIITCIPKENKSKYYMKNYRPISLLNCIYKIASGVIANRFKTTLHKLIHKDQTGFISGRYLGENTRLVYDIMHCAEQYNLKGLLLLIDFEKAFDSISWGFINKVLKFFGFGKSVISWVNLFFKDAKLAVNQGGNLSPFFNIGRGCRQGDSLSPYLFILCAEILAIKIRNNKNIKGIKIDNIEYKLSQYADDTSAFLDGSQQSLNETLSELSHYAEYSGLKVNFDKTQVVWIGRNKYSTETIKTKWKLTWGITHFKLLGIHFDIDLDKVININYNDKISKIETLIKIWNRRYLTPIGKITVVKTLLIPILNHLFMSLPNPPPCTIKSINNLFYSFIWQGPSKIKQSVLVQEYSRGGLKMININAFIAALKVTWIRRLILNDGKWANITHISLKELSDFGDAYILNKMKTISNPFWTDILSSLHKLMKIKNTQIDIDNALQTPIFFNENILVGRKPVFISTWYNKEVTFVNDLVKDNGDFYTELEFKNIFHVKTNFIQYQGIVNAIKSFANKNNITFNKKCISPIQPPIFSCITKSKRGCQDIYKILNNNKDEPTSKLKWQQIYTIDEQTWDKIFNSPFSNKLSSQ